MTIQRVKVLTAKDCRCKNDHPELDEFVASNVDIHFEAKAAAQFWMMVTDRDSGEVWHLNFGAVNPNAKGYSHAEVDSP